MGRTDPAGQSAQTGRLAVEIVVEDERWSSLPDLEVAIEAACSAAGARGADGRMRSGSVVVALLDDATVADLNQRYRGMAKPTNVLSFPSIGQVGAGSDRVPADRALGDIALAYETVCAEASEAGITVLDHARHLVVHGVLHLLGFDHETDEEAERMEASETRILAGMGIADPYAR